MNVDDGWQYAHSFDEPEESWCSEPPPQLQRLLTGSGAMTANLAGGSGRAGSSSGASRSHGWVRRRRWVRVMRRRLDIPPLPFLGPSGSMFQLTGDGTLIPYVDVRASDNSESDGQEMGAMPSSFLSRSQDYVARSRYLAGTPHGTETPISSSGLSAGDLRKAIAKLERAVAELRSGMLGLYSHNSKTLNDHSMNEIGDEDVDRRRQAEVLLNTYSRDLERKRLAAGAAGVSLNDGMISSFLDSKLSI